MEKLILKYKRRIDNLQSYIHTFKNDIDSDADIQKCKGQIEAYEQIIKDLITLQP